MPSYLNNRSLYNYPLFCQIWQTKEDFMTDYKNCDIPATISDKSAGILYALLCGEYYNSPIGYNSPGQWKQQIMTIIYCYGPTWEARLDLQAKLRNLSDDELVKGTTSIFNSAVNPSTPINTQGTLANREANYVTNQNTQLYDIPKVAAYSNLLEALKTDVTTDFLKKFKPYFCHCVAPQRVPYYIYEQED